MIVRCTKCHHEWQAWSALIEPDKWGFHPAVCAWCGATGEKIADDYLDRWQQVGPIITEKLIERIRKYGKKKIVDPEQT